MTFRLTLLFALLVVPATALAGSCPVCTQDSDCMSFDDGGVAFCVLHDHDVGCGAMRQICCPGQGCNTFSGRPSCEGTTCMVVNGTSDAGTPDAGTSGSDAGPGVDAGPGHDAGTTAIDASPGVDAGPVTTSRGGCCSVDGASPIHGSLVLVGLGLLGVVVSRRRVRR